MGKEMFDKLEYVEKVFPAGTRIVLKKMPDDPQPISPGSLGTVMQIGPGPYGEIIIYVSWDSGRSLNLIYGEDIFEAVTDRS